MTISLDLPTPLEEELAKEARSEGVSLSEQATFLLFLATEILNRVSVTRPFREVVNSVLERHEIDPERFSSTFEEIKNLRTKASSDELSTGRFDGNPLNHQTDVDPRPVARPLSERQSILGKYAYLKLSTEDIMAEKRLEIEREDRPR